MAIDSIPKRLLDRARTSPDRVAYAHKRGGVWVEVTWRAYAGEVRRAARAMIALGLEAGGFVSILGFNRPEWVIFDVAAMMVGAAPAGIYTTCSHEEVGYILRHSGSRLVLVENRHQYEKVRAERAGLEGLYRIVLMRDCEPIDDPETLTWDAFLAEGDRVGEDQVDARLAGLAPGDLATLIYTSGTTGPAKAVMLSHDNLAWTSAQAQRLNDTGADDSALSYLPLSHIAEQMFTIHIAITAGMKISFAESLEQVPANLREVRPTVIFGVPRIWEKLSAGIAAKLKEATGVKSGIASWSQEVGRRVHAGTVQGLEPRGRLAWEYRLADRLVFRKVKEAIGLDRARVCVSGAAPIAREILEFFTGLDLVIQEVYGQSEDCGPTSFNQPGRTHLGSVGPPFPGTEIRIADDDEILVRGRNVFLGYYKDPELTAETLEDGWLHSGDLGRIDAQGFLHITGRKKDIIITAGGKNIAPANIEGALKQLPLVSQAVLHGDKRRYLVALVTLDPEALAHFCAAEGLEGEALHRHPRVVAEVQRGVDAVNGRFARVEQVRRFRILPRDFSVEDGELTPSLKIKRRVVDAHFAEVLESMYAEAGPAPEAPEQQTPPAPPPA